MAGNRFLPPPPVSNDPKDPSYRDWFYKLQQFLANAGNVLFTSLDFTGSDLTSISTRNHNDLQNIQGGNSTERYHLTVAQVASLGTGAATRNVLIADTTVDADTSYIVADYFNPSTFILILNGNLEIV